MFRLANILTAFTALIAKISTVKSENATWENEHSSCQVLVSCYLHNRKTKSDIIVLPALRVQVAATRIRVPDITVISGPLPSTPILKAPSFLCIEILSRRDSADDVQDRIDDYLAFGVPHVWVVNPRNMRAFHYTVDGMR